MSQKGGFEWRPELPAYTRLKPADIARRRSRVISLSPSLVSLILCSKSRCGSRSGLVDIREIANRDLQ